MKISVIGAAGMVGADIVSEAIARGHEVRTFTKTGSQEGSTALDITNTDEVLDVVNASDVTVISTAGRENYDSVVKAHKNLIASQPTGRVFIVGSAGSLRAGDVLVMDTPEMPEEYIPEARAFAEVRNNYVQSSGLNWTMLSPSPVIAPGVRTGKYRAERDDVAGEFISTQDFAVAVLDEIENPQHTGMRFTAASLNGDAARS
ncbi:MAG: NAD(P)H-binding protein [Corynebacterium sp.]|nr:NAD(P)H-binding protein [Corynebacterium sp.]